MSEALAKRVVEEALDYVGCPYEAEVNLLLTENAQIHEMNKEFRGIDRATDVLSFPMIDYPEPGTFDFLEEQEDCFDPESGELTLGELQRSACNILGFLLHVPARDRKYEPKPIVEIEPLANGNAGEAACGEGDLSTVSDGGALRIYIAEDGLYGVNVHLMSRLTPMAQLLCRLIMNGREAALIQTNGTDGRWGTQQVAKLRLKKGVYELQLEHIRQGIVFERIAFKKVTV